MVQDANTGACIKLYESVFGSLLGVTVLYSAGSPVHPNSITDISSWSPQPPFIFCVHKIKDLFNALNCVNFRASFGACHYIRAVKINNSV